MFEYEAADANDLALTVGSTIVVTDTSDTDWWKGSPRGKPEQEGFFPASFVELDGSAGGAGAASPSTPGSARGVEEGASAGGVQRAKVMFDYEAEDETNITIAVGGVVVVTDSSDADWWQGYNEGEEDKEGYFPASFVEMLSASSPAP